MSTNRALWGRVRSRLRAFPEHLAVCGNQATAYGRCVQASTAPGGRLRKDLCTQEFEALRSCFSAAPWHFSDYCLMKCYARKSPLKIASTVKKSLEGSRQGGP